MDIQTTLLAKAKEFSHPKTKKKNTDRHKNVKRKQKSCKIKLCKKIDSFSHPSSYPNDVATARKTLFNNSCQLKPSH